MKRTALIMAGGCGERFWPKSRQSLPKQFLSLTDDGKTMIQLTVERMLPLVERSDIYIATNRMYRALVREQLPGIPEENILCEPVRRNTAPCIGLGAVHMRRKYGDAVMYVLPSDHMVKYTSIYQSAMRDAGAVAEEGSSLVALGITPDYPETGYGYIRFRTDEMRGKAFAVDCFVEKPDLETAKSYLATEQYLWNSGMFVWKVSSILENLRAFLPETYAGLTRIEEAVGTDAEDRVLAEEFSGFEAQSIDFGVMEKAKGIFVLPGSFGWDDVGSWLAVARVKKSNEFGNVVDGSAITIDSRECIIQGGEKLIAAVGLERLIIVDTRDALLVCGQDHAGDIKRVLETLRMSNQTEYL